MSGDEYFGAAQEGHYPALETIDSYGKGGFYFAGMSHKGSILCLPSGIWAWDVHSIDGIGLHDFSRVLDESSQYELLIIGTGQDMTFFSDELRQAFKENGVVVEVMATGPAVRTWNIVLAEKRAVAAALIAVDEIS